MSEKKPKKLKIDPNELLQTISETLKGFNTRLEAMEKKAAQPSPQPMPLIQVPDSDLLLTASITSILPTGETPLMRKQREKIFFDALTKIMKASKIMFVNARLTKKW